MKRRKTILCTILVLLAVSLAGLFWWQRDNLKAIHAATQHTSAELEEKLEENQQALNDLALSVRELATDQDNMKNDITEIKTDVKVLTAKPAKRWDGIVDKVLYAIIGAFVTWLFYGGAA